MRRPSVQVRYPAYFLFRHEYYPIFVTYLGVAQLVACLIWDQEAEGSSPSTQTLWAEPTGKDVFPLDKIVRVRECDFCGKQVFEDYIGDPVTVQPKMFRSKLHTVVLIPPEGQSKSWHLCKSCAEAFDQSMFLCSVKETGTAAIN